MANGDWPNERITDAINRLEARMTAAEKITALVEPLRVKLDEVASDAHECRDGISDLARRYEDDRKADSLQRISDRKEEAAQRTAARKFLVQTMLATATVIIAGSGFLVTVL